MKLFSETITTLERGLSYSGAKQQAISQNLANIDTPNYKAKDVSFRSVLNDSERSLEAKRTNQRHIPFSVSTSSRQATITAQNTQYANNGNSVDVDKEMAEMAENQIYYQALVDRLNGKFTSLQTVIRGGR
ncbi:flagellar basal body rod protein FlgB [Bacillus fonticola]|uniref:flagellar basal body rod protein FlgB n=1 Tax=Bacillus fonticola TaxID=2728853 RepID=UPI00147341BE|nr:flagellar basal body rod protein FlgB [Bacillus fonticola]